MPLIITPGQLSCRADFYHQLGQLTSAGLGLTRALEQMERHPPARSYRAPISRLLKELASGCTLTESVSQIAWLPEFDMALIQAGEHSGRLDACFRLLADYYQDRARLTRQMLADLAYPAFLFHFAIFIMPFVAFFQSGNLFVYLTRTFGILLPVYAVAGAMVYAAQSKHGETWRSMVESALRPIPVLGTARHYLALSRLAAALEALISAGVSIVEAWILAARASGSPALLRAVMAWQPDVAAGRTPAEVVSDSPLFPEMFSNQYTTGEVSGQLDETLRRLRSYYQEEGSRKLHAVAQWTPKVVYLFVAFMIAVYVINFYTGYFKQVRDAGGF
jgi:type II secretory pathway component PulF